MAFITITSYLVLAHVNFWFYNFQITLAIFPLKFLQTRKNYMHYEWERMNFEKPGQNERPAVLSRTL